MYFSHCGTFRAAGHHAVVGAPPLRNLADVEQLGAEVKAGGFAALKTNLFVLDEKSTGIYGPAFGGQQPGQEEEQGASAGGADLSLNVTKQLCDSAVSQLNAFRRGAGHAMQLKR
eukprot:SAG11_NODE_1373_length_5095_cov_3.854484_4_plen_115_part_00